MGSFLRKRLGLLVCSLALLGCQAEVQYNAADEALRQTEFVGKPARSRVAFDNSSDAIENRIRRDIDYLASDELQGRGPYSLGLQEASQYIAEQFLQSGLKTDLIEGQPFQVFSSRTIYKSSENNKLRWTVLGKEMDLEPEQFLVLSPSASQRFDLPVFFAGYGISSEEDQYDDYAGHEVAGSAVVVLRHEPDQSGRSNKFQGKQNSNHAYLSAKILNAIDHGAAAVIFVSDRPAVENSGDNLLDFRVNMPRDFKPSVPVIHLTRREFAEIFNKQSAITLGQWETSVDQSIEPNSFVIKNVRLRGKSEVDSDIRTQHNVLGVVPGKGSLAKEVVVVGAHYDHLGTGGSGSLAPWTRAIHNGADDNASGTVALMETARQWNMNSSENRRTVLFIAFAAEEQGLIGSEYYVRHPLYDMERTVAMLNFDMVGRLRADRLTVYGYDTAKQFDSWVQQSADSSEIKTAKVAGGYGPSDHASFFGRGVAVLHYFTGFHSDYHRPGDDSDKINVPGIRKIVQFNLGILENAATQSIEFNQGAGGELFDLYFGGTSPANSARSSDSSDEKRPRSLGIRTSSSAEGLRVAQVMEGSVAAKSGLLRGDIFVAWNELPIETLEQLRQRIVAAKAEQPIRLRVSRGKIELELEVTFAK